MGIARERKWERELLRVLSSLHPFLRIFLFPSLAVLYFSWLGQSRRVFFSSLVRSLTRSFVRASSLSFSSSLSSSHRASIPGVYACPKRPLCHFSYTHSRILSRALVHHARISTPNFSFQASAQPRPRLQWRCWEIRFALSLRLPVSFPPSFLSLPHSLSIFSFYHNLWYSMIKNSAMILVSSYALSFTFFFLHFSSFVFFLAFTVLSVLSSKSSLWTFLHRIYSVVHLEFRALL